MLGVKFEDYVDYLFNIYRWLIIVYMLMSWLPNVRRSFIGEIIGKIVEPYLAPFSRMIPPIGGMIDISPIVALFTLMFVNKGVVAVLQYFMKMMQI